MRMGQTGHDELVRMQKEEPAISKAIQWKTNRGEKPLWDEISHEGGDLKALWSQWMNLEVRVAVSPLSIGGD